MKKNPGRRFSEPELVKLPMAVVSMILRPDARGELGMLLVKRRISESDPWSGHMAFPGGRYKESDHEPIETAAREVEEEVGITIENCELLGTLDDVLPGNKSLRVIPFVFLAPSSTEVVIDAAEITDHVWIPLDFFLDKKNVIPMKTNRFGVDNVVSSYVYQDSYVVWGMTLRLIDDFVSKITRPK